jgi:hypothetical protein
MELRALLGMKFVASDRPPNGLRADGLGAVEITYKSEKGGDATLCTVTPMHAGGPDELQAGGSFGVCFIADSDSWHPQEIKAWLPKQKPIDASQHMALPRLSQANSLVRLVPWLPTVLAVPLLLFVFFGVRPWIHKLAKEAAQGVEDEIRSQADAESARLKAEIEKLKESLPNAATVPRPPSSASSH